jgi:protein-tyrosine kinase
MDTIVHGVRRLDPERESRQDAPGPGTATDTKPAPTATAASELVTQLHAPERGSLQEVPRFTRFESIPFTLDELRLERLLAPPGSESAYEELVANFHSREDVARLKTVLFVATAPGDGCSTTAFNFAVALSRNPEFPVLFIDADFRTPRPPYQPGARFAPGLSNLGTTGGHGLLPVAAREAPNLYVMPSGDATAAPLTLFRSPAFDTFISEMSRHFAHIIIDAPPPQNAPETLLLASKVSGVILVLNCDRSRRKIVRRIADQIRGNRGRLLGTVLNRRRRFIPDWLYRRL